MPPVLRSFERHRSEPRVPLFTHVDPRWVAGGLALMGAAVGFDYLFGFSDRLVVIYILPILVFTWLAGRVYGIVLVTVGCGSWITADIAGGRYAGEGVRLLLEWAVIYVALIAIVLALGRLRTALEEAHFASRRDSLTGLINKGGFYQVVNAEMEMCRRYRRTLSIAYIDCDNFKVVNDRLGHEAGDECLRLIARTMMRKLRSSDLPGRLGGDEFAVMLPETSAEACHKVVEMLRERLLAEMREHDWPVTFSIGIATFVRMPSTIDDMIRQADRLMYSVKHTRKGEIRQEVFGTPTG